MGNKPSSRRKIFSKTRQFSPSNTNSSVTAATTASNSSPPPTPSPAPTMAEAIRAQLAQLDASLSNPSSCDIPAATAQLTNLKIALTKLPLQTAPSVDTLILTRNLYESAVILSVHACDTVSFERHVAHLRPLYLDYIKILPPSQRQNLILALNLMRLVAFNRIAEFHTELELIPHALRTDRYISFVLRLESYLMEGSYKKIAEETLRVPDATFELFVQTLVETVRDEIAACIERAYESVNVADAGKLLKLGNVEEVELFCEKRGWSVREGQVSFGKEDQGKHCMDMVPSDSIIKRTLAYARELEQII